jgi:uncharacterized protein (DUF1810 family)
MCANLNGSLIWRSTCLSVLDLPPPAIRPFSVSSLTLFAAIVEEDSVFERLQTKYFNGEPDSRTIQLLEALRP